MSAESKEIFQRYFFKDGTFYKYTVTTMEDYFIIPKEIEHDFFAEINWKELNEQVLALKEEKEIEKSEPDDLVPNYKRQEAKKEKSKVEEKPSKENHHKPNKGSQEKVIVNQAAYEQEILRLTNIEREKQGLKPLKLDEKLAEVAREKSLDMTSNSYFSHDSPTYGSPFDMMSQFGITYYSAGENIAKGQTTPQEVVQAWMDSEGHKDNILHSDFTHIGIGFSENGFYWTQHFIKRLENTVNQEEFEKQVVDLTNKERAKHGLAPLSVDTQLAKSARTKSLDMAELDYFDHTSPTYGTPFDMMDQFGVTYDTAGENIARGQFTPEEVVQAWMNSEGHRENILNANYTHIGVGFVKEDIVWTQQFIGR